MIKISNLSDYACIVTSSLLREEKACLSASELSQQTGFAQPTVSKVLKLLNDADIVQSTRGVNGGYRAAKPAGQISVADVIRAIDGAPTLTSCALDDSQCQYSDECQLRGTWQLVNAAITSALDAITFEHMTQSMSLNSIKQAIVAAWMPNSSQTQGVDS